MVEVSSTHRKVGGRGPVLAIPGELGSDVRMDRMFGVTGVHVLDQRCFPRIRGSFPAVVHPRLKLVERGLF